MQPNGKHPPIVFENHKKRDSIHYNNFIGVQFLFSNFFFFFLEDLKLKKMKVSQ